mgnify:CR=1 FL=1
MVKKSLIFLAALFLAQSSLWAREVRLFSFGVSSLEVAFWPPTDTLLDHCHLVLRRMARFRRLHITEKKVSPEQKQNPQEELTKAQREQCYECDCCGYIYDPADGDGEEHGRGTPFHSLPKYWVCPLCEIGKDAFQPCQ